MVKTRHIITFWAAVVAFGISLYQHLGALFGLVGEISFGSTFVMHAMMFVFISFGITHRRKHQKALAKSDESKGPDKIFSYTPK